MVHLIVPSIFRVLVRVGGVALSLALTFALLGCSAWLQRSASTATATDLTRQPEMTEPLAYDSIDVDRIGTAIFAATNEVRASLNLKAFKPLPELNQAADLQASSNALSQTAGHHNIVSAWATPYDRVKHLGLVPSAVSENAALLPLHNFDAAHGYIERNTERGTVLLDGSTGEAIPPHTYASFARAIVQAWMNSPGHRANIVNPKFEYLGCSARPTKSVLGFDQITSIQVFYTPAGG